MRQKYSENHFDVGIIAVEISRAGATTTVIFSRILDIDGAFAACSTVAVAPDDISMPLNPNLYSRPIKV